MTQPDRWTELLAEFGRRRDETYGARVVELALGVRVRRLDVSGAPRGTVDGEILYPDGRTAALEITSVEAQSVWHLRKRLEGMKSAPAPGRLMWVIRPSSVDELERLMLVHADVIKVCEQHGVQSPETLPHDVIAGDADLRWLAWESGRLHMSGHDAASPRVVWELPIEMAVFGSEADEIAAGVGAALAVEPSLKHVAKLLRDTHSERHLFLIVGSTGLSNAAAFALIEPDELPTVDPELPEEIDYLWLGPGWGSTVTVWTRDRGWRNEPVGDAPPARE